jgi:hypothetical protein
MEFSVISVSTPRQNEYKKIDIYKKPQRLNQNTKPMAKIVQKRANSPKIRVRQPQRWGTTTPMLGTATPALGYIDPNVGHGDPNDWHRNPKEYLNNHNIGEML